MTVFMGNLKTYKFIDLDLSKMRIDLKVLLEELQYQRYLEKLQLLMLKPEDINNLHKEVQ